MSLRVFTYDPHLELPPGVRHADARTICSDESLTRRFIANGKPSLAHFADMFRYRMMRETGCCWVDTDMLCLSKPAFENDGFVFCRQADAVGTSLVNNAVLRLPPTSPALTELIAAADAAIDVDQRWGAIGPFLLTPVLDKHDLTPACARSACLLSDRTRAILEAVPAQLSRMGGERSARRELRPPLERGDRLERLRFLGLPAPGSYLHEAFERVGALDRFRRVATEDEVLRVMAKPIADSKRPARNGAIASD